MEGWWLLFSHSVVSDFVAPWAAAGLAPLPSTIFWSLPKFVSIELVILSNHLILCLPPLLPSVFPSVGVLSDKAALHIRWPKYCSFSISPPQ